MNIRLLTILTALTLLAAAVQAALPTWWWCGGLRLELLPAVVAYAALTLPSPRWAAAFGLLAGFAQDALSASPFGLTGLGWLIVAAVLCRWQDELEGDLPWVQLGAGALVCLAGALFVLPQTTVTLGVPVKLALLMFLSALVTPFVFALADWLKREARE